MSRTRRLRQQQKQATATAEALTAEQPSIPLAPLWLALAFLLPNLGVLACGFVFDDLPVIVDNDSLHVHSLRQLAHIWVSGYWPDQRSLALYRPVSQMLWALMWSIGGSRHPALFHALNLALGTAVVLLLYRLLLIHVPARTAFIAAALFALFPIHTDATTSIVGTAELLAAAFGLGALVLFYRDRPYPAVLLFALAVFSKESAAAIAALPLLLPRKQKFSTNTLVAGAGAVVIIAGALVAHHLISGTSRIPAIDNPMGLVGFGPRLFTAFWIQCLYVFKTLLPTTLSADYSYKQIPLVMGLDNWRAWAGPAFVAGAIFLVWRRPQFRAPVLIYGVLFSSTANVLFPIGTMMGERLVYLPSIGLALLLSILLAQSPYWKPAIVAVALIFGVRTAVRNLDWLNSERFYTRLVQTAPNSAKSYYSYGALLSARGDDVGAIAAYDRAIAIFPAYSEAFHNRGNALARLGRREEAMASYRQCLRFDPGHAGAAFNLMQLQAGLPVNPPRSHI